MACHRKMLSAQSFVHVLPSKERQGQIGVDGTQILTAAASVQQSAILAPQYRVLHSSDMITGSITTEQHRQPHVVPVQVVLLYSWRPAAEHCCTRLRTCEKSDSFESRVIEDVNYARTMHKSLFSEISYMAWHMTRKCFSCFLSPFFFFLILFPDKRPNPHESQCNQCTHTQHKRTRP